MAKLNKLLALVGLIVLAVVVFVFVIQPILQANSFEQGYKELNAVWQKFGVNPEKDSLVDSDAINNLTSTDFQKIKENINSFKLKLGKIDSTEKRKQGDLADLYLAFADYSVEFEQFAIIHSQNFELMSSDPSFEEECKNVSKFEDEKKIIKSAVKQSDLIAEKIDELSKSNLKTYAALYLDEEIDALNSTTEEILSPWIEDLDIEINYCATGELPEDLPSQIE